MNHRKKIEFIRWLHLVLLFFLITVCIVALSEFVIGPVFQYIFFNDSYIFPSLERFFRLFFLILFISFLSGAVVWCYEKYRSRK